MRNVLYAIMLAAVTLALTACTSGGGCCGG